MTIRDDILAYLGKHGSVESQTGNATSELAAAVGASVGGVSAMLRELEGEGAVAREVEGRRTYWISLKTDEPAANGHQPAPEASEKAGDIDYGILALELLQQAAAAVTDSKRLTEELVAARQTAKLAEAALQASQLEVAALTRQLSDVQARVFNLPPEKRKQIQGVVRALKKT
jgi:DNA-binding transcriptional regulator GbsR (MarR family)